MWPQAQAWAHKHGLSQDAFAEAIDFVAAMQVGDAQAIQNGRNAEIAKLGATGTSRFDAVMTWTRSMVGEKDAAEIERGLFTAGQIGAFERLIQKYVSQGGGNYSGARRDGDQPAKLTDEQYSKLTYSERKEYAAKFKQVA
jgi:hypothetical protein